MHYRHIAMMLTALFRSLFDEEYQTLYRIADLADDDLDAAAEAAQDLGERGKPFAVPALLSALEMAQSAEAAATNDPAQLIDFRQDIVQALGKLSDEQAVPALVDVLNTDPDRGIRYEAAVALRRIGTPAALAALPPSDDT